MNMHTSKNNLDPLHVSSGVIDHQNVEMRNVIRTELNAPNNNFLAHAEQAYEDVIALLSRLTLSATEADNIDIGDEDIVLGDLARHENESQLLLPLHQFSIQI